MGLLAAEFARGGMAMPLTDGPRCSLELAEAEAEVGGEDAGGMSSCFFLRLKKFMAEGRGWEQESVCFIAQGTPRAVSDRGACQVCMQGNMATLLVVDY